VYLSQALNSSVGSQHCIWHQGEFSSGGEAIWKRAREGVRLRALSATFSSAEITLGRHVHSRDMEISFVEPNGYEATTAFSVDVGHALQWRGHRSDNEEEGDPEHGISFSTNHNWVSFHA
jgi:hypothetical protein